MTTNFIGNSKKTKSSPVTVASLMLNNSNLICTSFGKLCPANEKKKETSLPATKVQHKGSMAAKLKNHNT